jgi:predicted metalloendopeptidase
MAGPRPGNDFFGYANHDWLHANTIPAGMDRWGVRNELAAKTKAQVDTLLSAARAARPGTQARKVADFRTAYLDAARIEQLGMAPLRPLLASIDQVQDRTALARELGRGMLADVDPLNWGLFRSATVFGLSVEESIHGERNNVPFLVEGGLGLGDRDAYLSSDAQGLRDQYQAYVAHLYSLAGIDRADERARGVVGLEAALARIQVSLDASANDHNADNAWARADFSRRAPGLDWPAFFEAAGLARVDSIVAWQPAALVGTAMVADSAPLEVWKDYLRFHLLDRYADLLPRSIAGAALTMHQAAGVGITAGDRNDRALAATQAAMSDAIGRMYAERYFPAREKARVVAITEDVRQAFLRRVESSAWMTPATKQMALAQIRRLYLGVGYPEVWVSYADLRVDPRDALGNQRRAEAAAYRRALAQVGRPVDRAHWWVAPQRVGAILIFQLDAYDFSAALLQDPKYDGSSTAAAYGSIGAIFGHDVSHYVDRLGQDYDSTGAERRWWTPEDSAHFEALAQPMVDQFAGYHPFPDVALNGAVSRSENLADLGGLAAAFDAYRRTLGGRLADTAYVHQQDRAFFLAFARSFRSMMSDATLRTAAATADHAPERYRVATVRNLDAWYDAFDVQPGDSLYLAPAARVRVW